MLGDKFVPTPLEVSFLPLWAVHAHALREVVSIVSELAKILVLYPGILPCHTNFTLVAVLNRYMYEALSLERVDMGANLAIADAKEVGEVLVASVAMALIVQRVDFDKQDFLEKRKLAGDPNLLGYPYAFEISVQPFHVSPFIVSDFTVFHPLRLSTVPHRRGTRWWACHDRMMPLLGLGNL